MKLFSVQIQSALELIPAIGLPPLLFVQMFEPPFVPHDVAEAQDRVSKSLGSGPDAHGQLLIYHDMFGLYPKFKPKMAKVFGNAGEVILNGLKAYHDEVIDKTFPAPENWFGMKDEEYDELVKMLD